MLGLGDDTLGVELLLEGVYVEVLLRVVLGTTVELLLLVVLGVVVLVLGVVRLRLYVVSRLVV